MENWSSIYRFTNSEKNQNGHNSDSSFIRERRNCDALPDPSVLSLGVIYAFVFEALYRLFIFLILWDTIWYMDWDTIWLGVVVKQRKKACFFAVDIRKNSDEILLVAHDLHAVNKEDLYHYGMQYYNMWVWKEVRPLVNEENGNRCFYIVNEDGATHYPAQVKYSRC